MSDLIVTRDSFNNTLSRHFDKKTVNALNDAFVLLLYWKESDVPGFKQEADQLSDFFREQFHYTIIRFEIPSENSFFTLDSRLNILIQDFNHTHSLLIIHYGGHGDPDEQELNESRRPRKQGIWAASGIPGGAALNWSDIQPKLGYFNGDVFLILDCCFGAQAARAPENRIIPSNVELIAAAPMGCKTPGPCRNSFTTALMKAMETSLSQHGAVIVRDLVHELAASRKRLLQTPSYFPHGRKATLILQPRSLQTPAEFLRDPAAAVTLRMMVRSPLDASLLGELVEWLTRFVPHEICGMEVVELADRATSLQGFISGEVGSSRSAFHFNQLPEGSKSEVHNAWSTFNLNLREGLGSLAPQVLTRPDENNKPRAVSPNAALSKGGLDGFLSMFKSNVTQLYENVQRTILAVPDLQNEEGVAEAIDDPTSNSLGLTQTLQLRLENLHYREDLEEPEKSCTSRLLCALDDNITPDLPVLSTKDPIYGHVLIEQISFEKPDDVAERRENARMEHLVKLLKQSPTELRVPACLGWSSEGSDMTVRRIALIYKHSLGDQYRPISLYQILKAHGGYDRDECSSMGDLPYPTLGQRFVLARAIGQSILKWHTVGVVHERVLSCNIILFRHHGTNDIDYSRPYLCGFAHSRHVDAYSNRVPAEPFRDLYQHPERQSDTPLKRYTKEHDIYSFGMLLFEIGMWEVAESYFKRLVRLRQFSAIRQEMLKKVHYLNRDMGIAYESATRTCIEKDFRIDVDDRMQSALALAFEERVLRKLDAGTHVDD